MTFITNHPVRQLGNSKFKTPLYDNARSILKKQLNYVGLYVIRRNLEVTYGK